MDSTMNKKRVIKFCHISSLKPAELGPYFADPHRLQEWICDFAEYFPETKCLYLSYGQDHFVVWQIHGLSDDSIRIRQTWMDNEDKIDVYVEFQLERETTVVQVSLIGEIPSEMEKEYRSDWQRLGRLP